MAKKEFNPMDWIEPQVWEKDWEISPVGDIKHKENGYEIKNHELGACQEWGQSWVVKMSYKDWVDLNTFIPAYIEACHRAGIETVYIDYTHNYPED